MNVELTTQHRLEAEAVFRLGWRPEVGDTILARFNDRYRRFPAVGYRRFPAAGWVKAVYRGGDQPRLQGVSPWNHGEGARPSSRWEWVDWSDILPVLPGWRFVQRDAQTHIEWILMPSSDKQKTVLILTGDAKRHTLAPAFDYAIAQVACPHCESKPVAVAGTGRSIGGRDYYRAKAVCVDCRETVGEIRAYVSTIFGLEEDERVLHGRPRVY